MIPITTSNLAALTVQSTLLALVAAPLPRLLGLRSPRARLVYWHALLIACLGLPLVQPWLPDAGAAASRIHLTAEVTGDSGGGRPVGSASPVGAQDGAAASFDAIDLVVAGVALRGIWLIAALASLSRLRRRARVLEPRPSSVDAAVELAGADAEFRTAHAHTRPATFGLFHPVVIVPGDFTRFTEDEQRAVACHELTHVRRRDWLRHLADEGLRAIAWFSPAVWWTTRQLRLCREQVVDQEVVRRVGARKPYLDALVRLASSDRGIVLAPAPLFLGRTNLSDRIALLLKEVRMSRPRLVLSFLVMAAVLFASGRVIVAAFPLHAQPAAVTGGETQQKVPGAPRPGMVTPAPAAPKTEGTWQRTQGARPVFPAGAPDVPLLVSMHVDATGAVVNAKVVNGPADMGGLAVDAVRGWRFATEGKPASIMVGFNPAAAAPSAAPRPALKVGGVIKPPLKVHDVQPVFPEAALKAHVEGVVIIESTVASDGRLAEARVIRSIPELDAAALTAVLGWKFTPTLMNGAPVDVNMTMTVNFARRKGPGLEGGVGGGVGAGAPGGAGVARPSSDLPGGKRAYRVGGDVQPPAKVVDVKPVYPQEAKDAGVQGIVIIEAVIGPGGKVSDAKVVRSAQGLDQAALDAVRQWEFTPTILEGKPVSVIMTVTVNFRLD